MAQRGARREGQPHREWTVAPDHQARTGDQAAGQQIGVGRSARDQAVDRHRPGCRTAHRSPTSTPTAARVHRSGRAGHHRAQEADGARHSGSHRGREHRSLRVKGCTACQVLPSSCDVPSRHSRPPSSPPRKRRESGGSRSPGPAASGSPGSIPSIDPGCPLSRA